MVLTPSGELTLACAAEWKATLLDARASGRATTLDLAGVTELDFPMLQLVLSAERSFAARGVPFAVRDAGGVFAETAAKSGVRLGEGRQ